MTINMNGMTLTLATIASIVTKLESGEDVTITNVAVPTEGPGLGAFLLGQQTSLAVMEQRIAALESRMNDVLPEFS